MKRAFAIVWQQSNLEKPLAKKYKLNLNIYHEISTFILFYFIFILPVALQREPIMVKIVK